MDDAARACDVNAAMDRVDPGRAGIRDDDSSCAQDRKTAHNAQTRAERARRQRLSARNRYLHLDVHGVSRTGDFREGVTDHPTRHGIDGGLPRWDRPGAAGGAAPTLSPPPNKTRPPACPTDGGEHQRTI